MSRKYEAHISVWEDANWRGTSHTNPLPLFVDAESFNVNKNLRDLASLTKDGRIDRVESQVGANFAPGGGLTFQPRSGDCVAVLFSHFQTGQIDGTTGSYTYTFFPSKNHPTYTNNTLRSLGTYGAAGGDVYSVSFLKKYFDTDENGGTNSIYFRHGICDSVGFSLNSNADFVLNCDYQFRDVVVGTAVSGNPGDEGYGEYSTKAPWQWFEGTVLIEDEALILDSINWTCQNNITQKFVAGRRDPEWFAFGDYVTGGEFSLDFPKDGMLEIGSMIGTKSFSIGGTLYRSGTELISFSMPNCIRRPFEVPLNTQRIEASIPFKALEKDGVSPITIVVKTETGLDFGTDLFWDAGTSFHNASRTFGDYVTVDGGTTFFGSSRTLGDYTIADRDMT